MFSLSFAKERNVLAFFSVLCKRMECSFRSLQKNGAFFSVLLKRTESSFEYHKLPKTWEKKGMFSFLNGKERNVPNGKERSTQPWPHPPFWETWPNLTNFSFYSWLTALRRVQWFRQISTTSAMIANFESTTSSKFQIYIFHVNSIF